MTETKRHAPWRVLGEAQVLAAPPWLWLSRQSVRLPDGRCVRDYYQLRLPDFVVAFVEIEDGRILTLRQYKHGSRSVTMTLPGGLVEPDENPDDTVRRELLEETGFEAPTWTHLGSYTVHGNLGCGQGHYYRASGARQVQPACSGDLEETELLMMGREDLLAAIMDGRIELMNHAAAVSLALASDPITPPR